MNLSAKIKCVVFLMISISLHFCVQQSFAEMEQKKLPPALAEGGTGPESSVTVATLKAITESIESIRAQLKDKEKDLKSAATGDDKSKIEEEIKRLRGRERTYQKNFEEIAAGVDFESLDLRPKEHFDWKDEIQDLLGPIVQELKSLTARPREIEKLRSDLTYYEKKASVVRGALESVQQVSDQVKDQRLKGDLKDLEKALKNRQQQTTNELNVVQYQLSERMNEKESVIESAQNILRMFFRSRGRNLTFALLAFIGIFLLLRLIHRYSYHAYPALRSSKRSFYIRFAEVTYHALTFTFALAVALAVLYTTGDWVLLGLSLIFLFGLAWTAKQALPRFFEQGKLLLNLGTVRENERIIYNGLPWRVGALNIYTHLINPELRGGMVRLRLRELIVLNSRPFDADEPWFPCKEGDWVILGDSTEGKVVTQTPEMVQLVLLGGSRKTYPTEEFLKQNPVNISTNFRLSVTFGIDYEHQGACLYEVPERLKEMLVEQLTQEGYGEGIISLKVEFKQAAASSLDFEIIADFSGKWARSRAAINRAVQRIAVEACNKYGWVIPFTQLVVHSAYSPKDSGTGANGS